jgi:hypothetical protein
VILARHGIGNSTVYNLEPHRLADHFEEVFDRILIDAPCSGESLFAKRDEKRKDVSHKEVERCALRQRAILEQAGKMLAPGGRMVYSTCAYSRTENEEVVSEYLDTHPEVRLLQEQRRFPHRDGVPGGYFAVLEKKGDSTARARRLEALRRGTKEIGSRGLVRDGLVRWDGKTDFYAKALDRKGSSHEDGSEVFTLDFDSAIRFLATENPREYSGRGTGPVEWESERIAWVEDGVVNYPRHRLRG